VSPGFNESHCIILTCQWHSCHLVSMNHTASFSPVSDTRVTRFQSITLHHSHLSVALVSVTCHELLVNLHPPSPTLYHTSSHTSSTTFLPGYYVTTISYCWVTQVHSCEQLAQVKLTTWELCIQWYTVTPPSQYHTNSHSSLIKFILLEILTIILKIFSFSAVTLLVGNQEGHLACKKMHIDFLVVMIWRLTAPVVTTTSIIPVPIKSRMATFWYRLTQDHLENGR